MSKDMSDPLTNSSAIQADSIETWDPDLKRYVDILTSLPTQASTYTKTRSTVSY